MTTLSETDSILTSTAIAMLARGLHADPFAVLGPHEIERDGVAGLVIRTVRPDATEVFVRSLVDTGTVAMTRLHPEGVFEAFLPEATRAGFDYRLLVEQANGSVEVDDPYRYGPVLTGFDQHLLGEGTHLRAFEKLGARPSSTWAGERRALRGVGAQRPPRQRRRRLQRVGRPRASDAHAGRSPGSGRSSSPDSAQGDRYKFEVLGADGRRC